MPVPETMDDDLANAPKHLSLIRSWKPSKNMVQMFGANRDLVQHAMAAEFGMIEMMDRGIGEVIAALVRLGLAENTVVVFTSDHGDMFGDHGLMLKATMHYQGCLRVPLVFAMPANGSDQARGVRTRAFASSLDLAQTFIDLAGAKPFVDMQGHSLKPLIEDPNAAVRDQCLTEEDFPLALIGSPLPLHTRTLHAGRFRYSQYSSGEVELYDLTNDPLERHNLAQDQAHRADRAEMAERLAAAMMAAAPMGVVA
jgi:arylsulfatase A-like enzyme